MRGAIRIVGALVAWIVWATVDQATLAQTAAEIRLLELDQEHGLGRYEVTLRSGSTLWDVANTYLPLEGLDRGDAAAYELVFESFQRAFPGRTPDSLRPDESFVLDVPLETFVTENYARDGAAVVYHSFRGDQLIYYPQPAGVTYRLVRQAEPTKVLVSLSDASGPPLELAREIYQVDSPDFLQLREVKAVLGEKNPRLTVDTSRRYLDDFRNYRERATEVEQRGDLKIYKFAFDDVDNPFVRVEDAIGDEVDPGLFPRECRLAYYRDGTVQTFIVTEPGDTLGPLARPDIPTWQAILPTVREWQTGAVERVGAFSPAVNSNGQLLPGRLLALTFSPKVTGPPAVDPAASATGAASLSCLGVPLAVILTLATGALRLRGLGS
jgi:hypothetical protein